MITLGKFQSKYVKETVFQEVVVVAEDNPRTIINVMITVHVMVRGIKIVRYTKTREQTRGVTMMGGHLNSMEGNSKKPGVHVLTDVLTNLGNNGPTDRINLGTGNLIDPCP